MPEPPPTVDIDKVSVDKLVLPPADKTSRIHSWVSLTPLLSVLITGIALIVSSALQVYQNRTESSLKIESDWRTALLNVDLTEQHAAIAALEMQTFLDTPKHHEQARSLAAAAVPRIADKDEFDTAFFVLLVGTNADNQGDLVGIARNLTNQLGDLYVAWKKRHASDANLATHSYKDFVLNPTPLFDQEVEAGELNKVLVKTWELDTAAGGLASLWTPKAGTHPIKADGVDLSGIDFLNADLTGADLRATSLDESLFIGHCKLDPKLLPATATPDCQI